jgi:hypothetical protein
MNSPDRQQPTSRPGDRPTSTSLSLKAHVGREAAAVAAAGGSTMAENLEDLDRHRRSDGPTTEDIVNELYERRREQGARDSLGDSW